MKDFADRLLDEAADLIILANENSQILYINRACVELVGYQPEELSGQSIDRLLPERFHPGS